VKEIEIRQLFLIILNTYNGFAITDAKAEIWADILQDIPFEMARHNLWGYIRNPENNFPPHPGVLADTGERHIIGPYIPNVEETQLYLQQRKLELMEPMAPIPELLRERMRQIGRNESPTTGTV
jgi:hypothetical protein